MANVRNKKDISSKIGSGSLVKGNGVEAFDLARTCTEDCPLYEHCNNDKDGKCSVHVMYMDYVQRKLGVSFLSELDDLSKLKVATELFPLYKQLLSLQLYEASLPLGSIVNDKGSVTGVYKEMRQCIVSINKLLEEIGAGKRAKLKQGESSLTDPDFHTKMLKGEVRNV